MAEGHNNKGKEHNHKGEGHRHTYRFEKAKRTQFCSLPSMEEH